MVLVLIGMLLYALLHTFMAGRGKTYFRDRFGERAYHGLYRLIYNGVAVLTILPVIYLVVDQPGPTVWTFPLRLEPLLLITQLIGLVGLGAALLQIDLMRFAGLSQFRAYISGDPLPLPAEKLQTGGLYRLVRHPLYLFSLLIVWPVTTMTSAYLGFALGVTVYFLVGSYWEEKRMLAYFGKKYATYREQVPWMLPFFHVRRSQSTDKT